MVGSSLYNIAALRDAHVVRFPGGKNKSGTYQRIINLMPPHRVYIEPFLGSGAILRMKRPAVESIGLDLAPAAIAAYKDTGSPAAAVLEVGDALAFLASYRFRGDELVYCDPPYLHATRTWGSLDQYAGCEMSDAAHRRFLGIIRKIPAMVLVSGYRSQMYDTALAGWTSAEFRAYTRMHQERTECLWFNYPMPTRLHDYRYLGEGYRERERIKRKKTRWARRLAQMPVMERQALLAALDSLDELSLAGSVEVRSRRMSA
jgi:hypothetical protein